MKPMTMLIPAVAFGVLAAATVFAAPRSPGDQPSAAQAPDRAVAYHLATAG